MNSINIAVGDIEASLIGRSSCKRQQQKNNNTIPSTPLSSYFSNYTKTSIIPFVIFKSLRHTQN